MPYNKRWKSLQVGKSTLTTTTSSLLPAGLIHLSKIKHLLQGLVRLCFFFLRWLV